MFCGCAQLHVSMWLEKRTGTRDYRVPQKGNEQPPKKSSG